MTYQRQIEHDAIEDFMGRLPVPTQVAVYKGMLWNLRNALDYEARRKQELLDIEQMAAELAEKGENWASW